MEAALYLIPVPLGDTPVERALPAWNCDLVSQIKYFIVENRRSAVRFLKKVCRNIDIDSLTFFELNEHTDPRSVGGCLEPAAAGHAVGVISEAGCPAVADPGAAAVEIAHRRGIRVIPLAGPSSVILSVMASGLCGQNFAFNGYLPAKPAPRAAKLRALEARAYREKQTQLFIEAPYRNARMIESILSVCRPATRLCVAAGIASPDEYIHTHTVAEWRKITVPDLGKIPAVFLISE